jgi:uncharacterized membrane protein required for colicin V production
MAINWIVDIAFMLIFAIGVIIGIKMGFVKTVAKPVKFVLAVFIAFAFAANLSSAVISPLISAPITNQLTAFLSEKFADVTAETVDSLPTLVKFAAGLCGVDIAEVASNPGESGVIGSIVEKITTPFTDIICTAVAFILLFFVAKLVLTVLFAIVDKVVDNGLIGVINKLIGAVFMGAFTFILCWCIAAIFELVINLPVFEEQAWAAEFTGGFVYKFLKSINPIDLLLSF